MRSARIVSFAAACALLACTSALASGERFSVLMNAWSVYDSTDVGSTGSSLNFRLRRAEVTASGTVVEGARWFLMVDPVKSLRAGAIATTNDNKIVQDFGIAFLVLPGLEVAGGQVKIPTIAESISPTAELLFPERALLSRTYGERREPGVWVSYKQPLFSLKAMVSNGQAANVDDTTISKDFTVRGEVYPQAGLTVGLFESASDWNKYARQKGRVGANARYDWGNATARAEYAQGKDAGVSSRGYFFDLGYALGERWQLAARYQFYNPNTDRDTQPGSRAEELCVSYLLQSYHAKLALSGAAIHNFNGTASTGATVTGVPAYGTNVAGTANGVVVTLGAQVAM